MILQSPLGSNGCEHDQIRLFTNRPFNQQDSEGAAQCNEAPSRDCFSSERLVKSSVRPALNNNRIREINERLSIQLECIRIPQTLLQRSCSNKVDTHNEYERNIVKASDSLDVCGRLEEQPKKHIPSWLKKELLSPEGSPPFCELREWEIYPSVSFNQEMNVIGVSRNLFEQLFPVVESLQKRRSAARMTAILEEEAGGCENQNVEKNGENGELTAEATATVIEETKRQSQFKRKQKQQIKMNILIEDVLDLFEHTYVQLFEFYEASQKDKESILDLFHQHDSQLALIASKDSEDNIAFNNVLEKTPRIVQQSATSINELNNLQDHQKSMQSLKQVSRVLLNELQEEEENESQSQKRQVNAVPILQLPQQSQEFVTSQALQSFKDAVLASFKSYNSSTPRKTINESAIVINMVERNLKTSSQRIVQSGKDVLVRSEKRTKSVSTSNLRSSASERQLYEDNYSNEVSHVSTLHNIPSDDDSDIKAVATATQKKQDKPKRLSLPINHTFSVAADLSSLSFNPAICKEEAVAAVSNTTIGEIPSTKFNDETLSNVYSFSIPCQMNRLDTLMKIILELEKNNSSKQVVYRVPKGHYFKNTKSCRACSANSYDSFECKKRKEEGIKEDRCFSSKKNNDKNEDSTSANKSWKLDNIIIDIIVNPRTSPSNDNNNCSSIIDSQEKIRVVFRRDHSVGFIESVQAWHSKCEEQKRGKADMLLVKKLFIDSFQSVSHEFGTALNCINNLSQIVCDSLKDPSLQALMRPIRYNSTVMQFLINDILDHHMILQNTFILEMQSFNLLKFRSEMLGLFADQVTFKNLAFDFRIVEDSSLPQMIRCDRNRIKSILITIIRNAVKYTQKGSILIIVKKIKFHVNTFGLVFEIQDTGIGLCSEESQRLRHLLTYGFSIEQISKNSLGNGIGGLGVSNLIALRLSGNINKGIQFYPNIEQQSGTVFTFSVECDQQQDIKTAGHGLSKAKLQKSRTASFTKILRSSGQLLANPMPDVKEQEVKEGATDDYKYSSNSENPCEVSKPNTRNTIDEVINYSNPQKSVSQMQQSQPKSSIPMSSLQRFSGSNSLKLNISSQTSQIYNSGQLAGQLNISYNNFVGGGGATQGTAIAHQNELASMMLDQDFQVNNLMNNLNFMRENNAAVSSIKSSQNLEREACKASTFSIFPQLHPSFSMRQSIGIGENLSPLYPNSKNNLTQKSRPPVNRTNVENVASQSMGLSIQSPALTSWNEEKGETNANFSLTPQRNSQQQNIFVWIPGKQLSQKQNFNSVPSNNQTNKSLQYLKDFRRISSPHQPATINCQSNPFNIVTYQTKPIISVESISSNSNINSAGQAIHEVHESERLGESSGQDYLYSSADSCKEHTSIESQKTIAAYFTESRCEKGEEKGSGQSRIIPKLEINLHLREIAREKKQSIVKIDEDCVVQVEMEQGDEGRARLVSSGLTDSYLNSFQMNRKNRITFGVEPALTSSLKLTPMPQFQQQQQPLQAQQQSQYKQYDSSIHKSYQAKNQSLTQQVPFNKIQIQDSLPEMSDSSSLDSSDDDEEQSRIKICALTEGKSSEEGRRKSKALSAMCCVKVLCVDDEPFNHFVMQALLDIRKIRCDKALDGAEAVRLYKQRAMCLTCGLKSYCLVLMDLNMPVKNGYEATQEIKAHASIFNQSDVMKIITCSAFTDLFSKAKAISSGSDQFLLKPINKELLFELMEDLFIL